MDNARCVYIKNTGGTYVTALTLDGSNHLQVGTGSSGGNVQLLARASSGAIQFFPGGAGSAVAEFSAGGPLHLSTGLQLPYPAANKTGTYAATVNDFFIPCDTSGGGFSVNLPAISSTTRGLLLSIKKVSSDGNTLTITPNGSDTIDGAASKTTTVQSKNFLLIAGQSGWHILNT